MSLSFLGGHWISKGMTGSGCNRVRGWSASKRDDPRCIYSGGMWFAARDIQVPDLNLSYPVSLPSPTPLIHPSSATLPSESSHGCSAGHSNVLSDLVWEPHTLERTYTVRFIKEATTRITVCMQIMTFPVKIADLLSEFFTNDIIAKRSEMNARGEQQIEEAAVKFNALQNYPNAICNIFISNYFS